MVAKPIALKARLVFPVASPPLDGGVVTLLGDRIVAVGRNETTVPARDLGDVALLPGLINAHTHLEFSNLTHPLGYRGIRLPDWIAEVVSRRRLESDQDGAPLSVGRRLAAMERGVSESQGGGVTTLGNIVTWDDTDLVPSDGGVRWHEFRELMGLSGQRVAEQVLFAHEYLRTASSVKWRFAPGFSPHAPYTTALQLVDEIVEMSARHRLDVAMHLAESREELQLLETGGGPFRELLEKFGVWDNRAFAEKRQPHDYLQRLSKAHRSLAIHGNYLEPSDWSFLAQNRQHMALVYCPRTHDYFGHERYPLTEMKQANVRIALGTDSRASNPNLNMLEELQFAARRHPDLAPQELLSMATSQAAAALGVADQVGTIESGKQADLAVVQLGEHASCAAQDPYCQLLEKDTHVLATWVGGIEYPVR